MSQTICAFYSASPTSEKSTTEDSKKMSTYKEHRRSIGSHINRRSLAKKVNFQMPSNLKGTILDFTTGQDHRAYQDLVCILRDSDISDGDLISLLQDVQECISLLNQNLRLFVQVLLVVKWAHRGAEAVEAFQNFLINLCSAHSYHTKSVIDHLFNAVKNVEGTEWPDGFPPAEEEKVLQNIHLVFWKLLKIIPMASSVLVSIAIENYPYIKRDTHEHQCFVHMLIMILESQPNLRKNLLHLIVNKMVQLDVCAPHAEIDAAEDDCEDDEEDMFTMEHSEVKVENSQTMKHPAANTLDLLMLKLFRFIEKECQDGATNQYSIEKSSAIYRELLEIFESLILPTHNICHVQFIVWHLCTLRPKLAEVFVNYLWRQVSNVNAPAVMRQAASAYIASFLARAKFIKLEFLKSMLQEMSDWIHSYISKQDGQEFRALDMRVHLVFFSVCQALFYVVTFRHRDLFNTRKNMVFLRNLNMSKIVTSSLNPLKVCLPEITKKFSSVTRAYQLVYCNTIVERNSRSTVPVLHLGENGVLRPEEQNNILETFFPFDPYKLKRSGAFINPTYNVYQAITWEESEQISHKPEDDDDDFLHEPMEISSSLSDRLFSYSTSPGFRQNGFCVSPHYRPVA